MHAELEAIVAADEEGRARVRGVEERWAREVGEARSAAESALARRWQSATNALEQELAQLRAAGDERVAALRRQQEEDLQRLRANAEPLVDAAAALWLRIVCGETP